MHVIGSFIIGFIVGLLARALRPGKDSMGWIMTTLLGIGGALIATWLGRALGLYGADEPAGFIASILGAVGVLAIYGAVAGRSANRDRFPIDRDRRAA